MGARKNNPNKFFGTQKDPKRVLADFAAREGFRTKLLSSPRFYAWEIARGDTSNDFECALVTYDPAVRLWAITHNSIPEVGSDRFEHLSPQAAWDWYKSPRPKQS